MKSTVNEIKVRFNLVATAVLVCLVLGLSGGFLATSFKKFDEMASENAQSIFRQIATNGSAQFLALLSSAKQFVQIQAAVGHSADVSIGSPEEQQQLMRFAVALQQNPNVYALFMGFDNGDFMQVVGVRGNAMIVEALSAPRGTWIAERLISHDPAGVRTESWRFLNADGALLGARQKAADYDPRTRPWFKLASTTREPAVVAPYIFSSSKELGITVVQRLEGNTGVMAADVNLRDLSAALSAISHTPNSFTALVDEGDKLVSVGLGKEVSPVGNLASLTPLGETDNPFLKGLRTCSTSFQHQGQECQVDELQAGIERSLTVFP